MIKKRIIFYLFLVFFINSKALSKENIYIAYEINGEIITNVDIKNEKNYLNYKPTAKKLK